MPKFRPRCAAFLSAATAGTVLALVCATAVSADGAFVPVRKSIAAPSGAIALCRIYQWACEASGAPLSPGHIDLAREVSRQVNAGVQTVTDEAQYGTAELWSLPSVRGGDCEDFTLLKKRVLISRGLPADRLLIAAVLDKERNSHAVLVLRTKDGDLVLDNLTDHVLDWRETGYTFVRMQDPSDPTRWVSVLAGGILSASRPV